jgi:hypothetical protein
LDHEGAEENGEEWFGITSVPRSDTAQLFNSRDNMREFALYLPRT